MYFRCKLEINTVFCQQQPDLTCNAGGCLLTETRV